MIPVTFTNNNNQKLFGIIHEPQDKPQKKIGIIILSPGIKSRVAPHRMYIKMARKFVELGFVVLRFDFYGLGDSEGEVDEEFVADLYGSIQVGRYIEDTKAAMDWMGKQYGINEFILSGLCGGAITGMFAGANDDRVIALHGLGIPVILDTSDVSQFNFITQGQLQSLRKGYVSKLVDPQSWKRFFQFKSDYRMIIKSLFQPLLSQVKKKTVDPDTKNESGRTEDQSDNFNYLFPEGYKKFAMNKKMCLIFSETDRLYWEFEEKFKSRYTDLYKSTENNVEIYISKDANHIFSFLEWQQDMLEKTCTWLRQNYCRNQN